MSKPLGIRRSLSDLQAAYDSGDKVPLETVMRAWKGIKELPSSDPNSFFMLGGFHGEPFRGPGETDGAWWGGYCQHGTVLFPTWHRTYLYKLEQALQSIPGCEGVMLPFWDECSEDSQNNGIPRALTDQYFQLDGAKIDNPLRSFVLPVDIDDQVVQDNKDDPNSPNYSKPKGYETVRYPLSGLVGTQADRDRTAQHNAGFPSYNANVKTLDANIMAWLTLPVTSGGKTRGLIADKFKACLDAPTYTLFSNTTSMTNWNNHHKDDLVTALESPHNFMHLAVGGFDIPAYDASPIAGANGDMGENDTAGLDPIFFFHHCFIDYTFWIWQRRNGTTKAFTIDPGDPGAAYIAQVGSNNQPPAGADPNAKMSMNTELLPFLHDNSKPYVSADCIDIQGQLNYTYGPGSLDRFAEPAAVAALAAVEKEPGRTIHVTGLDRSKIAGSFLVAAYAEQNGKHQLVGVEPVLSRWDVGGCSNCQTHLKATADFRISAATLEKAGVQVLLHTRHGLVGDAPPSLKSAGLVFAAGEKNDVPFAVEIR
jgi:tyrosinase